MGRHAFTLLCLLGTVATAVHAEGQSVAELVQGSEFRYTKGNIDIQVLSNLIAERQKALSNEVLHRYLLRNQTGSLSQNILNERLIDQLLNNHTPKEITQGLYSYTMETFALGMMSLVLDKSTNFGLPSSCKETDANGDFRIGMSDSCRESLRNGSLRPVYVIDSLLRLMERTQDSMVRNAARQMEPEPITIDWVIEHISRQAKTAELVRETQRRLKSIRVSFPQENRPTLATVRRQFLTDMAFVIASDSMSLFGGTLFRNGSSQGYLKSHLRMQVLKRWMLTSTDLARSYTGLRSSFFDVAELKMSEIKSQLLRSVVSEYVSVDYDSLFKLVSFSKELKAALEGANNSILSGVCLSAREAESGVPLPELFNRIVGCNDSVAKRQIPLENIDRSIEDFKKEKSKVLIDYKAYEYISASALQAKVDGLESLVLEKADQTSFEKKKSEVRKQKESLIALYDSISGLGAKLEASAPDQNANDAVWRDFVFDSLPFIVVNVLPKGSEIVDYAGIQKLKDGADKLSSLDSFRSRLGEIAKQQDELAKKIKGIIGLYNKVEGISSPRQNYLDMLTAYRKITELTAKAMSPGKTDSGIIKVKRLLDSMVVKDTLAIRLIGNYDKYLSLWLMNSNAPRDSTRDTLALLFLQKFLPALRNASFSDSGIKKLYKRSIPLVGFVKLPKVQGSNAADPILSLLIPWMANYSTRTRSQNLQAAVQLMRDNESLFAELIPSSSTREWIWLITDGLDIDTAKDIISVEIPKLLTKIEKKYKNEVKAASLPIYPILDIGIFSAIAYGKDTTDFIQVASEKVGFGIAFWKAKTIPTTALIEDPLNISGETGVSYVEKAGLEFHASGLLYNSTNMKTNKAFNDALFSVGLAVNFRLGLTARVAYGWGYSHGDLQHRVLQAAMDVPLADYLVELGKK